MTKSKLTLLTRKIGHCLQLLVPELGELDGLPLASLAFNRVPLLVGVIEHLVEEVRVHGVEYIIEVLAWWPLAFREDIWEVLFHLVVIGELRPDVLHRELVVVWHFDEDNFLLAQQLFLAREHLLQEVFVDRLSRREIELHCIGVRKGRSGDLQCLSR